MTDAAVATPPTAVATSPPPAPSTTGPTGTSWWDYRVPVATALTCAWWLLAAPRMWGGRSPGAVTVGALLTLAALLVVRPDQVLPRAAIWCALAVSAAAFLVAASSSTGWAAAGIAATYVCAAWTVVTVAAAVVRDRRVVDVVLAAVVLGAAVELAEAWLPWWGGQNLAEPMTGTFYWHDPFATFLVPGAAAGLWLWLRGGTTWAPLGLLAATAGAVGVVYSTSRAAGACLAVAVVAVLAGWLLVTKLAAARRGLVALAVMAAAVAVVAGPPFFPHRSFPLAGGQARAATESLRQNGGYRLDFWHEAWNVFRGHPLNGRGFGSLAGAARGSVPSHWPLSPLAHNGYLQTLSDGGILLALPFGVGVAALGWFAFRGVADGFLRRSPVRAAGFPLALCLGALLVHSVVDVDWSYPAILLETAVVGGAVTGLRLAGHEATDGTASAAGRTCIGAAVVLLLLAAWTAHAGELQLSYPLSITTGGSR